MLIIAVPKETIKGENRVAATPASVTILKKMGVDVLIEKGAGELSAYSDKEYIDAGAKIIEESGAIYKNSDIILKVRAPVSEKEITSIHSGAVLAAFMNPYANLKIIKELSHRGVTTFALEFIPRSTKAQGMDAVSSMSSIAGYKAVIAAANILPKYFPLLMTAAGTVPPAKVFIIGAGVAGLMAIATARRLGAVVQAYDTRPAVKEQVESLGAKFVEFNLSSEHSEDAEGYAKEESDTFYKKQRELMSDKIAEVDVIITTALIPGKKAPILITDDMLKKMKPGSIIVDLAADGGGNVEGTEAGKDIKIHGITILGYSDFPSKMPFHASQLYAKNISSFLNLIIKEGKIAIDRSDEIISETLITYNGKIVNQKIKEL